MTAQLLAAGLLAGAAVALLVPPDPVARFVRAARSRGPGRPVLPGRAPFGRLRRAGAGSARSGTPVPVVTDLVAAALLTGLPPTVAVAAVAEALDAAGDPAAVGLRAGGGGFEALTDALALASTTGLGPVPLVRAAADQARRSRAARSQVAARRLGTLVVLPTGLCLLPAFVLLTVAPLVLDLLLG